MFCPCSQEWEVGAFDKLLREFRSTFLEGEKTPSGWSKQASTIETACCLTKENGPFPGTLPPQACWRNTRGVATAGTL